MPVNDKIRAPDYNNIKSKIDSVLGPGSGNSGYGQPITTANVGESNKVSINEWGALRYDIINAWKHIYGTIPTIVLPTDGSRVRYSNTFVPDSGASDAPVTQFDTYCNTIIANRFTVHPSQSATQNNGSTSTTWPISGGAAFWTSRITCTVTATWTDASQARYFFNSGGLIRISASRSGGSSTQQNTSWTNILTNAGVQSFGGNVPEAGTSPMNGKNFYKCTNVYQQWYSNSGSTPYGSNTYAIYARTPDVSNNSAGSASRVEFLVEFLDNYVDPGNSPLDVPNTIDAVNGTFTVAASNLYATGTLEPPGSGSFVVQRPTVTFSAIG